MHKAWKKDELGDYVEMNATERIPYSLNCTDLLVAGETISTVELTLHANVTQFGATQVNGNFITFILVASGAVGSWNCSCKINGSIALIKILPFRVKIK